MKIKFKKEEADFIRNQFCCNDSNIDDKTDVFKSTYFSTMVFIQNSDEKYNDIFEMKHISELEKEDILVILRHILTNYSPTENFKP